MVRSRHSLSTGTDGLPAPDLAAHQIPSMPVASARSCCGARLADAGVVAMSTSVSLSVTVNGSVQRHDVPANLTLSDFLREWLGLSGTKVACDQGACGAAPCSWMTRR